MKNLILFVRGGESGRRLVLMALCVSLALLAQPFAVGAEDGDGTQAAQTHTFVIPAGPLDQALTAFGRQSGLLVSVDATLTEGVETGGVRGDMSNAEALRALLADTGLIARFRSADTVTVEHLPGNRENAALEALVVTAELQSAHGPVDGYRADRAATATKTDALVIDIPAAIQVVPRDVIEDQGATRLAEVVRNVSSIQTGDSQGNRNDNFTIRGFSNSRIARDGFLSIPTFTEAGFLDLANVERVEVLKGPASVLYGQNEPGGLINLVSKKPQPEPAYRLDGSIGRYDFYRGEVDLNQPLSTEHGVYARLNASHQQSDSFRDYFIDAERTMIAPSLRWVASANTTIDLQLEHYQQEQQFDRGLVAVGDRATALPRERYLGEDFSRYRGEETRVQALIDHRLNADWSLRTLARYSDSKGRRYSADPLSLQADNRTLERRALELDQDWENHAVQSNLTGRFDTGPLGHEMLVGVDANRSRFDSRSRVAALDSIDIFDPQYGAEPGAFGDTSTQDRRIDFYGLYLQDLISIGDHWKLLLGGRFDYVSTRFDSDGNRVADKRDRAFSPRAGLVYQPVPTLSLYASYTQSFIPLLSGQSADGSDFDPMEGEQIELGVKREWFDGRLSAGVAVFELTRKNVTTPDPANPGFNTQVGEQRSHGVELDVAGEPLPNWRLIASLAYLDTEIVRDNSHEEGNRLPNAPRWSGSLWNVYTLPGGHLQGLELGAGIFAVGRREGDLDNSYQAPGYARVDLLARYRVNEHVQVSLNVHNLLDKDYIEAMSGRTSVEPGAPRSAVARVGLRF